MQYIKWNSSAQSASVKKAAFFRESISDNKKIQNKQSIHAKVQFQYTKGLSQNFSVMSIR